MRKPKPPRRTAPELGRRAPAAFATRLLRWFDRHGRRDLPWQHPRTPYRVWLSEVMLQQTQVATVIPYFERFVRELPTLADLAAASEQRVLALWAGLGYYRRARHLHAAARRCVAQHAGELPDSLDALAALPGIGRSTAAAILAQAHGQRQAILDGNVKRVLARHAGVRGAIERAPVLAQLWREAEARLPRRRLGDYTQAAMDLGAAVCTPRAPRCAECPVATDCVALAADLVAVLPERTAKRASPTRRTAMLLVHDAARRVLLEQRPPTGVWPGLWSLPESPTAGRAGTLLRERHALRVRGWLPLPRFVHVFSHYRLAVTPLAGRALAPSARVADDGGRRWLAADEIDQVGVPAPVRELLNRFWNEP